jgi:hypothetical protein
VGVSQGFGLSCPGGRPESPDTGKLRVDRYSAAEEIMGDRLFKGAAGASKRLCAAHHCPVCHVPAQTEAEDGHLLIFNIALLLVDASGHSDFRSPVHIFTQHDCSPELLPLWEHVQVQVAATSSQLNTLQGCTPAGA